MSRPRKTVAVVTPMYRPALAAEEEVSFRHLCRHLGAYDRFLVVPEGLDVGLPGFGVRRFDAAYFRSPQTYSALLLQRAFYDAFQDYEFILIYQWDALVFSDALMEWCAKGYDYIGAPWVRCPETPHVPATRVGNGGLSLRRVESCRRVLHDPVFDETYWVDPDGWWDQYRAGRSRAWQLAHLPRRYLMRQHRFNSWRRVLSRTLVHPEVLVEDEFWSYSTRVFCPWFRLAPVEDGMRFAFENAPRTLFEASGGVLPFGCHQWTLKDPDFWAPYVDRGDELEPVGCVQAAS